MTLWRALLKSLRGHSVKTIHSIKTGLGSFWSSYSGAQLSLRTILTYSLYFFRYDHHNEKFYFAKPTTKNFILRNSSGQCENDFLILQNIPFLSEVVTQYIIYPWKISRKLVMPFKSYGDFNVFQSYVCKASLFLSEIVICYSKYYHTLFDWTYGNLSRTTSLYFCTLHLFVGRQILTITCTRLVSYSWIING